MTANFAKCFKLDPDSDGDRPPPNDDETLTADVLDASGAYNSLANGSSNFFGIHCRCASVEDVTAH